MNHQTALDKSSSSNEDYFNDILLTGPFENCSPRVVVDDLTPEQLKDYTQSDMPQTEPSSNLQDHLTQCAMKKRSRKTKQQEIKVPKDKYQKKRKSELDEDYEVKPKIKLRQPKKCKKSAEKQV